LLDAKREDIVKDSVWDTVARYTLEGARNDMLKIRSRGNETVEQMLKRFKKLCEKEGLTKEIKRNSYYEKPSERKRRALRKAVRQGIRKQRFGSK